ncbi:polyisoprenoid-binding protein [Chitinophaga polysaccharea]|uniref:YceI family protein n=1 Tax=Chitinophaga TaxID=79328 RepID=UPI001455187F|nr:MULTISPECIES: YceI family protein [Chitinophaga]NLR57956.1 polyisoprenoid-binding protein [Chitinophaga polysaccharea]NLU93549.1 polyisoprenoid-binding protein [Chitinophaga sp. Ak27]
MAKQQWTLDPTHSELGFKIRHLMITNISGKFHNFTVDAETEGEDFMTAKVTVKVDVDSITTGSDDRDKHLRSPDFFDVNTFRDITFVTTKYENVDNDGSYELWGDLTIRNVTKNVKLAVEFGGVVKDPWGNTKAGFTINGKINRKDFGLTWNAATETGGVLVGDDVKLYGEVQLIKK